MKYFSARYGYISISDILIHEEMTVEIRNAICSSYDKLIDIFYCYVPNPSEHIRQIRAEEGYEQLEKYIWQYVLNRRLGDYTSARDLLQEIITNKQTPWYFVLDLIEASIDFLRGYDSEKIDSRVADDFIEELNFEFKRLYFAYRIVADQIVDIITEEEIESVSQAIAESPSNIQTHLSKALEMYAQRPEGDYRNSIKESISAVEAWCRDKTGENTLGKALKKLEQRGIIIPPMLKQAFEKLYAYTNDSTTGIRHALLDETEKYTPNAEEALFLLISCSSFINYLNRKL